MSKQSFLCARISALERENAELKKQADGLAEALKDAAHELNVIRARDGAPLGVSEDYWDCLTTRCLKLSERASIALSGPARKEDGE